MVSDGEKTFIGGEGELFEEFIEFRQLRNYPGQGSPVATVSDVNYTSAKLCMVRFDQSFINLPYDARRRE